MSGARALPGSPDARQFSGAAKNGRWPVDIETTFSQGSSVYILSWAAGLTALSWVVCT
jgi:hypothetical protein